MNSYFPDINVWLALSVREHSHSRAATSWLQRVRRSDQLIFSRYTQLGFLRLLTNPQAMKRVLTTSEAWAAYDRWLGDPRVDFHREPRSVDNALRQATAPLAARPAAKWIGDCYLLAFARETGTTLVTFDQALYRFALEARYAAYVPE